MKKEILLLLLLLPLSATVFSQERYYPGAVVKGEHVTYQCKKTFGEHNVLIINTQNKDTTDKMYYVTGEEVIDDPEYPMGFRGRYTQTDLYRVMKEFVTPVELDSLKAKWRFIRISVVADSEGNAREISFTFNRKIKEFQNISPDRYFLLEQKLKKLLKVEGSDENFKIRNIKYYTSISFCDIPD